MRLEFVFGLDLHFESTRGREGRVWVTEGDWDGWDVVKSEGSAGSGLGVLGWEDSGDTARKAIGRVGGVGKLRGRSGVGVSAVSGERGKGAAVQSSGLALPPLLSSPSESTLRANDDVTPSASTFSPPHRATPSQTQTHSPENEHVQTRFSTFPSSLTEIRYPHPRAKSPNPTPRYYYDIQSN